MKKTGFENKIFARFDYATVRRKYSQLVFDVFRERRKKHGSCKYQTKKDKLGQNYLILLICNSNIS